jgi:hypothetical protein
VAEDVFQHFVWKLHIAVINNTTAHIYRFTNLESRKSMIWMFVECLSNAYKYFILRKHLLHDWLKMGSTIQPVVKVDSNCYLNLASNLQGLLWLHAFFYNIDEIFRSLVLLLELIWPTSDNADFFLKLFIAQPLCRPFLDDEFQSRQSPHLFRDMTWHQRIHNGVRLLDGIGGNSLL